MASFPTIKTIHLLDILLAPALVIIVPTALVIILAASGLVIVIILWSKWRR
jgi:hypothetical protein